MKAKIFALALSSALLLSQPANSDPIRSLEGRLITSEQPAALRFNHYFSGAGRLTNDAKPYSGQFRERSSAYLIQQLHPRLGLADGLMLSSGYDALLYGGRNIDRNYTFDTEIIGIGLSPGIHLRKGKLQFFAGPAFDAFFGVTREGALTPEEFYGAMAGGQCGLRYEFERFDVQIGAMNRRSIGSTSPVKQFKTNSVSINFNF